MKLTVLLLCLCSCSRPGPKDVVDEAVHERAFYELCVSHHPVPVRASPDCRKLLLYDGHDPSALRLELFDLRTRQRGRSLTWPRPFIRLLWSPDGTQISFFSYNPNSLDRDLWIWNTETGETKNIVGIPPNRGADWLEWSPDSRHLMYRDSRTKEHFLVDEKAASVVQLPLPKTLTSLSWAPDSGRLVGLDSSRANAIEIVNLRGQVIGRHQPVGRFKITGMRWAPKGEGAVISLSELGTGEGYGIGVFDFRKGRLEILAKLAHPAESLSWSPDGRSVLFQHNLESSKPIFRLDCQSRKVERLRIDGFNEIRRITPDSSAAIVAHLSDEPEGWYRVPFSGGRPELLYQPKSQIGAGVRSRTTWVPSFDGFRVPAIEYRSPIPARNPSAVIGVHGGEHLRATPTWDAWNELTLMNGTHYLLVNFRGSSGYGEAFQNTGDTNTRARDILAAAEYAHTELKVPYERIALVGHSEGAALILAAARIAPTRFGLAVLVCPVALDPVFALGTRPGCPRRVILVHPNRDWIQYDEATRFVTDALGPAAAEREVLQILELEDEHGFNSSTSWPAVHHALVDELARQ
jgi:dipeptidyl aminopeptidase/acylaminoacyl peptidase